MNEMRNETANENWLQSASEVAKNSSFSFSLNGWPAAVTLISISISVVLIYAIKTFADCRGEVDGRNEMQSN